MHNPSDINRGEDRPIVDGTRFYITNIGSGNITFNTGGLGSGILSITPTGTTIRPNESAIVVLDTVGSNSAAATGTAFRLHVLAWGNVSSDATLTGDGTSGSPLSVANPFTTTEKTKLDGIEDNATADQTAAEIKTAYESNSNTNVFDDAAQTKLAGIASGAQVNVGVEYTSAEKTKLAGIEASATADQTAGEIKTAYESNTDTNAFTDADHNKLDGIAAGAQVNATQHRIVTPSSGDTYTLNADESSVMVYMELGTGGNLRKYPPARIFRDDLTATETRWVVDSRNPQNDDDAPNRLTGFYAKIDGNDITLTTAGPGATTNNFLGAITKVRALK